MAKLHFEEVPKNRLTMRDTYFDDNYLSLKAKGLLGIIYDCRMDFNFTYDDFAALSTDYVGTIRSAFRELVTLGYLSKKMLRDKNGRFVTVEYTVHALPRFRIAFGGDVLLPIDE